MTNARAAAALGIAPATGQEGAEESPKSISAALAQLKPQIAMALPRHMSPDRMLRIILTEMRVQPKLFQCEQKSLFGAVIQAAQLGLEPGSALGQCYLIPFENKKKQIIEAQLMLGYRGMVELAWRSGKIASLESHIVYEDDEFKQHLGSAKMLIHNPNDDASRRHQDIKGAYAMAEFVNGGKQWIWMRIKEIEQMRSRSRAKDSGPWVTDYEAMVRKTPMRQLFKWLPISVDMLQTVADAVTLDTAVDRGDTQRNWEAVIEGEAREVPQPSDDDGAQQQQEDENVSQEERAQ